jgi:flavin-binding protein dodecin
LIQSEEKKVSEHIYKMIEIVGSSSESSDDAVRNAIKRAAKSIHNMNWFEVVESRGHIQDGEVAHWQVTLKIGFRLEDE